MRRVPVESSNLAEVGWEAGTMEVLFRSGRTYRYRHVPPGVFLRVAWGWIDGSVGRTFHRLVMRGGYEYERIK